jgi:ribosomal-protein-alanine N-acetyltransferase
MDVLVLTASHLELISKLLENKESSAFDSWSLHDVKSAILTDTVFGLVNNQDLLGLLVTKGNPDAIEILYVYTRPELRGRGYAEVMIRALMNKLGSLKELWLEVHEQNAPAVRLYERLGFKLVGKRENYYADGARALLFSFKPLQTR